MSLASQKAGLDEWFQSATIGRFGELQLDAATSSAVVDPAHVVWAVRFNGGRGVVCPPPLSVSPRPKCWSPPAVTVVYLDYLTGDSLTIETYSPDP